MQHRQVVGVGVHLVAVPRLARAAVSAPVVGDDPEAVRRPGRASARPSCPSSAASRGRARLTAPPTPVLVSWSTTTGSRDSRTLPLPLASGLWKRPLSGVVTLACAVGVDQALRRAVGELEARGLEVFAVVDHSGEAAEVGLTMPDTKLMIFGSPRAGTPLMLEHPLLALDLPLKLLIWEADDARVFVSYNDPGYLANRYQLSEPETAVLRGVEVIACVVVSDPRPP